MTGTAAVIVVIVVILAVLFGRAFEHARTMHEEMVSAFHKVGKFRKSWIKASFNAVLLAGIALIIAFAYVHGGH